MTKRDAQTFKALRTLATQDVRFYLDEDILSRWNPEIHAAQSSDESTINIYDIVGEDWWTGQGMTAKIVSSVLNKNKGKEITVNINSPGGDFFEGLAIYNLLKEHDAPVTVKVVGLAASAASVVAMAGTTIKIAEAGYLMLHRAWTCVCGNSNDMTKTADRLLKFDETMYDLYAKKSGMDKEDVRQKIAESDDWWIAGKEAVELGYATQLLDSDDLDLEDDDQAKYNSSLKEVDVALARAGKTRSQRRGIIKDLTSTPGATVKKADITPSADVQKPVWEAMAAALKT